MHDPELKLNWSPEAEADLLDIWRWGAMRFSLDAADAHLHDIHDAANGLTDAPFLGPSRDDLGPGIRARIVFPTVILYRVGVRSIDVVRVVDGRRNLAAIFARDDSEDGTRQHAA